MDKQIVREEDVNILKIWDGVKEMKVCSLDILFSFLGLPSLFPPLPPPTWGEGVINQVV